MSFLKNLTLLSFLLLSSQAAYPEGKDNNPTSPATPECQNTNDSNPSKTVLDSLQPFIPVIAGAGSSGTAATFTYSPNLIKMRLQTGMTLREALSAGQYYKGFSAYAPLYVLNSGLNLAIRDYAKENKVKAPAPLDQILPSPAAQGLVSGVTSNFISSPFWVYQTKKALNKENFSPSSFKDEVSKNPLKLFRGQLASVGQALGNGAGFFQVNEVLQKNLTEMADGKDTIYGISINGAAGAMAKVLTSPLSYPFDTLRVNRIVTDEKYIPIFKKLIKKGYLQPYKGFLFSTIRSSAAASIYMDTYPRIAKRLRNKTTSSELLDKKHDQLK